MAEKARIYKGYWIRPCVSADHKGRWIIQTYHRPTGTPWSDEECPHFGSLAAAREYINVDIPAWEQAQI